MITSLQLISPLLSDEVKSHEDNLKADSTESMPYFLDINVNQVQANEPVLSYIDSYQHISIPAAVLKEHGIKIDSLSIKDGYISLHEIDWVQSKIDLKQQKLWLIIPPDKFGEQKINGLQNISKASLNMNEAGSYINYDMSAQSLQGMKMQGLSGLGELVHFNSKGYGSTSGLFYKNDRQQQLIRLDSNWTYDQPENQASWRFGDSITRSDDWGGSARFAGVQWATDYTFQSNFLTFPTPSIKGESAVPSNLDIFVNDALQLSKQVDRGPFGINDLPVVNGQGNVTVITKDILGRRQEVVIPYYVNQDLLKMGLQDYSFEAGILRRNYGRRSHQYGQGAMAGTYRQGLTNNWTLGGHSEITAKIQNVGFTNQYLLSTFGVVTNSVAVSHYLKRQGILVSQGFIRQSSPVSFGTKIQVTKGAFGEIGVYQTTEDRTMRAPQLTLQNFVSYASKDYGTIGFSYTERRNKRMPNLKLMTINYNKPVAKNFNLNIFASHDFKRQNKQVGLSLVYVIDDRSSAIVTSQYQPKNSSKSLAYQENKVMDSNISYRLLASQGAYPQYETQVDIDEEVVDYRLRASRVRRDSNIELSARGAMIYFGDKVFLSKYIYNSFGLVQIPNLSSVSVYESNRLVGKTNADGYLLVPNLRSYEDNDIKIDSKDLPLDTMFKDDNIFIKPARRSGAIARFDVSTLKMITIRVVDENNHDLNPGTVMYDRKKEKKYVVGLDGEAYIDMPLSQKETQLDIDGSYNCVVKVLALSQDQSVDEMRRYQCKNISSL